MSRLNAPTSKRTCALHGAFHGLNFGDQLLAHLYCQWVADSPSYIPALPFVSSSKSRALGLRPSSLAGFRQADALVYCGGGYLGEPNSGVRRWGAENLIRFSPMFRAAKLLDMPVAVLGAGAGPITSRAYRRFVAELVEYATVFAVRDTQSRDCLASYGCSANKIEVTADAVLSMDRAALLPHPGISSNAIREVKKSKPRLRLGVHLAPNAQNESKLTTLIDDLSSSLQKREATAKIIRDSGGVGPRSRRTTAFLQYVTASLGADDVLEYRLGEIHRFVEELAQLDAIITNKLHVGIVGLCLGIPVVAVSNHQKTERLYTQLALEHLHVALEDYKQGSLSSLLDDALCTPAPYVPDTVSKAASANRSLLHSFLGGL